jgi:ribose-phosphate pyrophosphokinase
MLVANLLSAAGTNRVLTMDLHKAQIQGFFDIPVDHLFAAPVIIDYLVRQNFGPITIVSPDVGGAERARAYAKRLDADLAIIDKRRSEDGAAEVMNNGATRVLASAVHGVLSGPALNRIEAAPLDRLVVTNSVPLSGARASCPKIVVLSVARLLAQAIKSIHEETSVSKLFV